MFPPKAYLDTLQDLFTDLEMLNINSVVGHLDLDGFYAQVEIKHDPDRLLHQPVAVLQYNPYGDLKPLNIDDDRLLNDSNGSIIALDYIAKGKGIRRNMRGDEARRLCPDLQLVQVPVQHGKADLTLYRREGAKVLNIFTKVFNGCIVERASIDEAYIDLTTPALKLLLEHHGVPPYPKNAPERMHIVRPTLHDDDDDKEGEYCSAEEWWSNGEWEAPGEVLIAAAAYIMDELRAQVTKELGYTCSGGLSHTKILAKLCSGLHKPNQQTIVPARSVSRLLNPLPIPKLRQLGGELGERLIEATGAQTIGQLAALPLVKLESIVGEKDGQWLSNLVKGIDNDIVTNRQLPKSIGCSKTFRGDGALQDFPTVHHWLTELASELEERLATDREDNARMPELLTVHFNSELPWKVNSETGKVQGAGGGTGISRSCHIGGKRNGMTAGVMADDAVGLIKKWVSEQAAVDTEFKWRISNLMLSAYNFIDVQSSGNTITKYFKKKREEEEEGGGGDEDEEGKTVVVKEEGEKAGPSSNVPLPDTLNINTIMKYGDIDEAVLAELPDDIQKEIREQMKREKERRNGGGTSQRTTKMTKQETGKKKKRGLEAGTVTLQAFLKGKMPKKD